MTNLKWYGCFAVMFLLLLGSCRNDQNDFDFESAKTSIDTSSKNTLMKKSDTIREIFNTQNTDTSGGTISGTGLGELDEDPKVTPPKK